MKELKKEVQAMVDQMLHGEEEISTWIKKNKIIKSVKRLPGDASMRRYYRVRTRDGSYIVMKTEPFPKAGKAIPFLTIRSLLEESGICVPAVYDVDSKKGFVLLEDLGDTTLLHRLRLVSDTSVERRLYEKAIDCLVDLQNGVKANSSKGNIPAFSLRFDHEKLMWEVNYTVEHFFRLHLQRKIRPLDLKVIEKEFGLICKVLADEPTVFVHRDYHSRNIMVTNKKGGRDQLVMIDFQDARMGPRQYDLASLLKDSYYQLEEFQIQRLAGYYVDRWKAVSGEGLDREGFIRIFDLMSVQRNFKAIGSFASFLNRRGNATYLKYIGNTFENIRRVLFRYPEYSSLREVLFHYYYF